MFDSFLRIISALDEAGGPDQAGSLYVMCGVVWYLVWCGVVWFRVCNNYSGPLVTMSCYECSAQKTVNMTPTHYIYQYWEILYNLKEDSRTRDNNVIKL